MIYIRLAEFCVKRKWFNSVYIIIYKPGGGFVAMTIAVERGLQKTRAGRGRWHMAIGGLTKNKPILPYRPSQASSR